jgi:hypothetical protein
MNNNSLVGLDIQGSDCINPFIALQNCIKENKEVFIKEILEEEENDDEADKSNLCLRHGPEKPNQRNEVYGIRPINITIAIINFPHCDLGKVLQFGLTSGKPKK